MSSRFAARKPREMVEVVVYQLSPVYHMQFRSEVVAFLVWSLGCSLGIPTWVALSISQLELVLSFRSSIPGKRSVRSVGSKMTFLCGVVSFTTGLTGWVDKSRSSVFLMICIAYVGIVGNFIVRVTVGLTTTIHIVIIVGAIRVILGLVFFSFELTTLVSTVTWLFVAVTSWFGRIGVLLCSLWRHSV